MKKRITPQQMQRAKEKSFANTYECLQYINICVLYEYADREEKQVVAITKRFIELNQEDILDQKLDMWAEQFEREQAISAGWLLSGFNQAQIWSMALIPKGWHDKARTDILCDMTKRAIIVFGVIAVKVLTEDFGFDMWQMRQYVDGFREVCKLLPRGLSADWLVDYIQMQIGWEMERTAVQE